MRRHFRTGEAFDGLRQKGICVNLHYLPVHLQPYYRALGSSRDSFRRPKPMARRPSPCRSIAGLSDAEQDRVIAAMRELLGE